MKHIGWVVGGVIAGGLALGSARAQAQNKVNTVPDAQVEANVLKALAGNPKLADQTITSTTVYGTVTLSGSVRDEDSRKLAEMLVSRTPGVEKVIDELTLGDETTSMVAQPPAGTPESGDQGSNPLLQSDGTIAPATGQAPSQAPAEQQPADAQQLPPQQQPAYGQPGAQRGQTPDPNANQPYGGYPSTAQQAPYGQQQPPYATTGRAPYGPSPYTSQRQPYGAQIGGQPVTIPVGALLRVRINQGLDSKHTQPGTTFQAVVLNDVVAGGYVAVPRGATVQGTVVDAEKAGVFRGRGELALQLNIVTLGGRTYPITSDTWSNVGGDKTSRTVNSALGLGALGAIIGGVTGGGAGAAIGAGVGGAAGVGSSAASGGGQAFIPAEAILAFHLTQPAGVATVSQAEMDRLGYGVQNTAQMRRRYPAPVPYPGYYPRYPYPYPY